MAAVFGALLLAFTIWRATEAAYYDSFTGNQMSEVKYRQYERMNLVPYCAIEVKECDEKERRRLDYSCNNLHYPPRGATLTPYRRMLPPEFGPGYSHKRANNGGPLPNVRNIRISIMSDGRVASEEFTHLVPNGAVTITGDITSVHDTANYVALTTTCCAPGGDLDPRCVPIYVDNEDVHLRRSNIRCLNLTKVITYQDLGCAPRETPPERVNTSPPMLEMSILYGNDERSAMRGREMRGGRLRADTVNGQEWPPDGAIFCLLNQRQRGETRCHNTPVGGFNVLIGSNVMLMWVFRLHNNVARALEKMNPCWDDDRLYYEAREVVIACVNQIWYYEMMPQLMGYEYLMKKKVIYDTWGHVDDYDEKLEPRVSIEYVLATRWFHTMQEGRLKTYDKQGKLLDELKTVDLTLRTGVLPNNRTLEGLTQGFFRQPSAAIDHLIDPDQGKFLDELKTVDLTLRTGVLPNNRTLEGLTQGFFRQPSAAIDYYPDMGERVLGGLQRASDVMSSDLMKGREAGLPSYNKYREYCKLPVAKDFDDLLYWMPEEQVDGLRQHYATIDDVEVLPAMACERPDKGSALPPTLACIMSDQLRYWRQADRFWYENSVHPGAFTPEQLYEIRKMRLSRLICDQGDEVDYIQPWAFLTSGPENEMVSCKKLPKPSLSPWKDESCASEMYSGKPKYIYRG